LVLFEEGVQAFEGNTLARSLRDWQRHGLWSTHPDTVSRPFKRTGILRVEDQIHIEPAFPVRHFLATLIRRRTSSGEYMLNE
jgi:hypothetical protein